MKNKKIFIAIDTSDIKRARKIINEAKKCKIDLIPKFGLQFFYSKKGRFFLERFKNDFWLDLKINDIPQTALSAINSIKDLKGCKYITAHANGGLDMLKAIKKEAKKKKIKVLGVTILTSLKNESLKKIGYKSKLEDIVLKQAILIKKSGCDGIVCSAREAILIRKKLRNLMIITPGIRLPGDNKDDQSRVTTPFDAFKNNVSGIVIGRSLVSGNIKKNFKRLIRHLNK